LFVIYYYVTTLNKPLTVSAPPHQHRHISIATSTLPPRQQQLVIATWTAPQDFQRARLSVFLEMACTPISKTQYQSTFFFMFLFFELTVV